MRISTKGRYALRVMADLARNEREGGYTPLKDIAARQGLTVKYLEQIIALLSKAGLLRSARGVGGGYHLVRAAEQYTVGEILRAAEGSLAPAPCVEEGARVCPRGAQCHTYPVWAGLYRTIEEYLGGITLQDVCRGVTVCPGADEVDDVVEAGGA